MEAPIVYAAITFIVFLVAYQLIKARFVRWRNDVQYERDLDAIEKKGLKAHLYFPAPVGTIDYIELYSALSRVKYCGFIFTEEDGSMAGKIMTARPSSEQLANERRAMFKIVE